MKRSRLSEHISAACHLGPGSSLGFPSRRPNGRSLGVSPRILRKLRVGREEGGSSSSAEVSQALDSLAAARAHSPWVPGGPHQTAPNRTKTSRWSAPARQDPPLAGSSSCPERISL